MNFVTAEFCTPALATSTQRLPIVTAKFQNDMRVRGDVGDAIALFHTERLQGSRPGITAAEKFFVAETEITINNRFPITIELPSPPRELEGS